jgi:hypothetical protein
MVKFDQALRFRSHEQVAPNARHLHKVVDEELKRVVDLEDMLRDPFRRRALLIGECNMNSKPPA